MPNKAYRSAEQLIEQARRTGATSLDLSPNEGFRAPADEKLTELPEALGQLTQLQSLNLSYNRLTTLPEWLGQLTQLQSLNLSYNRLTTLPESLRHLTQSQSLNLSGNQLTTLPEWLGQLTQLQSLNLSRNQLTTLPEWLGQLTQLQSLYLHYNQLTTLPEWLGQLTQLRHLEVWNNKIKKLPVSLEKLTLLEDLYLDNPIGEVPVFLRQLTQLKLLAMGESKIGFLPDWVGELSLLKTIYLQRNNLTDLPPSLAQLEHLEALNLDRNPLNPELAAAYKQGFEAVKAYLRAKAKAQITLNEAKLILIGEGEVGKSCLLGALRGDEWAEGRPTTHGIEIKPLALTNPNTGQPLTLNGWDFGGQRVYRPTHQLFFSAPAVYLVVWKPREGPQQGFVKEWIRLVKHRAPEAKILVVATHGGPGGRQPDIDRQELWDAFGKDTVLDFFFVDSKPDEHGHRKGIEELKAAIASVAASLPEVGRSVPKSFQDVRKILRMSDVAYLPLAKVLTLCQDFKMADDIAQLFISISHTLGHLIHYQHDPALRDIVVLKPDWLATAMSFVLDDEATRNAHGLVSFTRLGQLWAPNYTPNLHPVFLHLMERYDLSYRVALPTKRTDDNTSLIAQLVPDNRLEKDLAREWPETCNPGDAQQTQICRIVDDKGNTAPAEGLFYQLIVRLHKYSLGRANYHASVHWQRGLLLDADYNGRALLEHKGNDVHITVRAPYPERFLAMLTEEVKFLVESFWEGLRCNVMVPCLNPNPCIGLFEVRKLIENKQRGRPEQPCPVCNEWQSIDALLNNAPAAQPDALTTLLTEFGEFKRVLESVRHAQVQYGDKMLTRFDRLDDRTRRTLSKVDDGYGRLMQLFTDEAKEGPRLFSLAPVKATALEPQWFKEKFKLVLWCEHSRLPLPILNEGNTQGEYEIELTREWVRTAAPYLKALSVTLSLVLPVAAAGFKLATPEAIYKTIETQLDLGQAVFDTFTEGSEKLADWAEKDDTVRLQRGGPTRAEGGALRALHALLKTQDPTFGGLVRVLNKQQKFLWVHKRYEGEY